jgi:hypothetical protein
MIKDNKKVKEAAQKEISAIMASRGQGFDIVGKGVGDF